MKTEIWKDIVGYEGLYQVSNLGKVKSLNYKHTGKERVLQPAKTKNGYLRVQLYKDGEKKIFLVHRLVAEVLIQNPLNLPQVNHKSEVKTDNRVENLEWMSPKENINYGTCIDRRRKKYINGKKSKIVLQYSLDGEFLREWPSTREVERQLGFYQTNISSCCLGKYKQVYGFIWKYKKEVV